ncbi:MAG: hypothetical protein LM582_09075 [Desulfurococcaceae archaeon]|nr:hypothetical protein [Desulfurococcaceae archaeon]
MSDIEEVIKKIDECIQELDRYKYFSSEAWTAIDYLGKVKNMLRNLNKENAQQILGILNEMIRQGQPYSSFIPRTIENLKFIREWLEKKILELPS